MTPERNRLPSDRTLAQDPLAHDVIGLYERRARALRLAAWGCVFRWLAVRFRHDRSRLPATTAA